MLLVQIVAAAVGALLVGASVLLYEQEESLVEDILAVWWIKADDATRSTYLQNIARRTVEWLDDIYGRKLLSWHAVGVSLTFSVASSLFFAVVSIARVMWQSGSDAFGTIGSTLFVMVPAVVFLWAAVRRDDSLRTLVCVAFGVLYLLLATVLVIDTPTARAFAFMVVPFVGFALGVLCDFVVVVVIRRIVAQAIAAGTVFALLIASFLAVTVSAVVLVGPFWIFSEHEDDWWSYGLLIAGTSNVFAAVLASAIVVAMVSLLLLRVLGPLGARALYALHRFSVHRKRGTLFISGATLIGVAVPQIMHLLLAARAMLN